MTNDTASVSSSPANINLTDEEVTAAGGVVIPLYVIPLSETEHPEYKVGIRVGVGPRADSKVTPVFFEFDTGGKGFWADSQALDQDFSSCATHGEIYNQYDSGITYVGVATDVYVTLFKKDGHPTDPVLATVGLVDEIFALKDVTVKEKDSKPKQVKREEQSQFPIFPWCKGTELELGFWGDFGASLQATSISTVFKYSLPTSIGLNKDIPQLLTVLSQFPYKKGAGFIVDLANLKSDIPADLHLPAGSRVGRLILGGMDTLRARFASAFPLTSEGDYVSPATGETFQTFLEAAGSGDVFLLADGVAEQSGTIGFILDTGAPFTTFHRTSEFLLHPKLGDRVMISQQGKLSLLDYVVGDIPGANETKVQWTTENPSVNTGLAPYFLYPVAFDLTGDPLTDVDGFLRFASS